MLWNSTIESIYSWRRKKVIRSALFETLFLTLEATTISKGNFSWCMITSDSGSTSGALTAFLAETRFSFVVKHVWGAAPELSLAGAADPLLHLPEYLLFISIVQLKPIKLFTDSNEQRKKYIRVKRVVARRFGKRAKWRWEECHGFMAKAISSENYMLENIVSFQRPASCTSLSFRKEIKRSGNKKGFCAMELWRRRRAKHADRLMEQETLYY